MRSASIALAIWMAAATAHAQDNKAHEITSGDDLVAAKRQAGAMAKTKRSLRDVVAKIEKANAGYKAVGVAAELEDGAAKADVALLKGTDVKQVEDKL